MKKFLLLLLAVWQLVSCQPLAQAASQIPAKPTNNIYVQDYSKVLSANTKATIMAYSQAIAARTKAQLVVVTIPTLNGDALEDYATSLYRSWGIGDKEKNNGVLLLVVTKDRKSRIEVGYGLEGALPDGLTGRIQDQYMIPSFKQGNYDKGILNGYSALVGTVLKEYKIDPQSLNVQALPQASQDNSAQEDSGSMVLNIALIVGFIILLIVDQLLFGGAILRFLFYAFLFRGGGRGGGGGFGGGGGSYGGGSSGGGGSRRNW